MKPRLALTYTVDDLKKLIGFDEVTRHTPPAWSMDPSLTQPYPQVCNRSFYTLTNYLQLQYLYVLPEVEFLTGYPCEMVKSGGVEFMFSLLHPIERKAMRKMHEKIFAFSNSLPPAEKLLYRYMYDVRLQKKDGEYIRLLCEHHFLELDPQNHLMVGRETYTEITDFDRNSFQTLVIHHHENIQNDKDIILHFKLPGYKQKLGKKEKEVCRLVKDGYTSKEIGDKLHLSKNTVDTYRRRIHSKKKANKEVRKTEHKQAIRSALPVIAHFFAGNATIAAICNL